MATGPQWAGTPRLSGCKISTANTARDGSGTLGTVIIAEAAGTRVDLLSIKAQGTVTNGMIRVFVEANATKFLVTEVPVIATTPSGEVSTFETMVVLELPMQANAKLLASTEKAEAFDVFVVAGDF